MHLLHVVHITKEQKSIIAIERLAIDSKIWFEAECICKSEQCTVDTLTFGRKKEFSKCKRHEGKVDLRMKRLFLQE